MEPIQKIIDTQPEKDSKAKKELLGRVYLVTGVMVLFAFCILAKAIYIQVFEGKKWRSLGAQLYLKEEWVDIDRGNIFSEDSSILATSVPIFDVHMDMRAKGLKASGFQSQVDSLALCLYRLFYPMDSYAGWKQKLQSAYREGHRFFPIANGLNYAQLNALKKFPILRDGQNKGGIIIEKKLERLHPFRGLALRTLGAIRDSALPLGIEGYYDHWLSGGRTKQLMQKISGGIWIPVKNISDESPRSGHDIITTLDMDIQDVAHQSITNALIHHDADYGVAIVMEVQTGKIVAMVNLKKDGEDVFEDYNHAIAEAQDPGSTMKMATVMTLLESGKMSIEDTIHLDKNSSKYHDCVLPDAENHEIKDMTLRKAFIQSSNIAISRAAYNAFDESKSTRQEFVNYWKEFGLDTKSFIDIYGEGTPFLKSPTKTEDQWSGITLPWMSVGYELNLTPLQVLTFYNAIANKGKRMKPYLVSSIQKDNQTVKRFHPTVLKSKIASSSTIKKMDELLRGVVDSVYGTAHGIQNPYYRISGKTGTAQLIQRGGKYEEKHRATFVGYFPSEHPTYSCIVTIVNPKQNGYTGGVVSAPVFKQIADKCFSTKFKVLAHLKENTMDPDKVKPIPQFDAGMKSDFKRIANVISVDYTDQEEDKDWGYIKRDPEGEISLETRKLSNNLVPNVKGMGLRDAMYLLENSGLRVNVVGVGKVKYQSIMPGTESKGQNITIRLD